MYKFSNGNYLQACLADQRRFNIPKEHLEFLVEQGFRLPAIAYLLDVRVWTSDKCLATKHHQTFFWCPNILPFGHLVWCCLIVFDRVWPYLIKGHQTFDQNWRKTFLLFTCLIGNVLFVWTAAYQTCLMRQCVPRLLSGLYQLFHLCLIEHVLTVWPLTSTLACLVTKQCLMVFGR